jgi:hypothetical protein
MGVVDLRSSVGFEVPRMPPMSGAEAERWAEQIVRRFRPDLLERPGEFPSHEFYEYHLVEEYGLNTGVAELPFGVEGITYPNGKVRIATHVYEALCDGDVGRAKLTPVHESIHGIVHLRMLRSLGCHLIEGDGLQGVLHRREDLKVYEDPEWQANRIAGAVLMPRQAMRTLIRECGADVQAVVGRFGVSRAAADLRLKQLANMGMAR